MSNYEVQGRLWIKKKEGRPFLGPGRILLLQKIEELGSIRAAAKALGMSYRRAWRHVEALNREAPVPLVKTTIGGQHGGGASLTPAGKMVLKLFESLEINFQKFLEHETKKIEEKLDHLKET